MHGALLREVMVRQRVGNLTGVAAASARLDACIQLSQVLSGGITTETSWPRFHKLYYNGSFPVTLIHSNEQEDIQMQYKLSILRMYFAGIIPAEGRQPPRARYAHLMLNLIRNP